MRIHILSDLHLEFGPFMPPSTDADLVILAGDIDLGIRGVEWASRNLSGLPVIYVMGNHEFYGHSAPDLIEKARKRGAEMGVHVLSDEAFLLDGIRFLGTTLWTDFDLLGDRMEATMAAERSMLDYRRIHVSPAYRRLRPSDTLEWHHRSAGWLSGEIARGFDGTTIVITHHAPSIKSIAPRYSRDILSAAFASDLDELVSRSTAEYWIHGHTHHNVDYRIGATRVLSNQRGYVGENVPGFRPDLVLEV